MGIIQKTRIYLKSQEKGVASLRKEDNRKDIEKESCKHSTRLLFGFELLGTGRQGKTETVI